MQHLLEALWGDSVKWQGNYKHAQKNCREIEVMGDHEMCYLPHSITHDQGREFLNIPKAINKIFKARFVHQTPSYGMEQAIITDVCDSLWGGRTCVPLTVAGGGNAVGGPTCAQHACPDAYYYINALFWDSLARGEMQHQNKRPNERLDTSTLKGTTW